MKKMNASLLVAVLMLGVTIALPLTEDNEIGNDIEQDNTLSFAQDWVKITKTPPKKVQQKFGEPLHIECEVMGSPAPLIEWRRGKQETVNEFYSNHISEGSPSAIIRAKKILRIEEVVEAERTYTCIGRVGGKAVFATTTVYPSEVSDASDIENAELSHKHRVEAGKPKIVYSHPLHIDIVGTTIVLPCHVTGSPKPKIQWANTDGYVREDNTRYKILNSGDLMIKDIKWEDMGAFKCIAKNEHGKDSADSFIYPALKE